jgi:hypothetical protein
MAPVVNGEGHRAVPDVRSDRDDRAPRATQKARVRDILHLEHIGVECQRELVAVEVLGLRDHHVNRERIAARHLQVGRVDAHHLVPLGDDLLLDGKA